MENIIGTQKSKIDKFTVLRAKELVLLPTSKYNDFVYYLGKDMMHVLGTERIRRISSYWEEFIKEKLGIKLKSDDEHATLEDLESFKKILQLHIKIILQKGGTLENDELYIKLHWDKRKTSFGNVAFNFVVLHDKLPSQWWRTVFTVLLFNGDETLTYWKKYGNTIKDFVQQLNYSLDPNFGTSKFNIRRKNINFCCGT